MYNSINNYNKLIKIFLKNIFSRFLKNIFSRFLKNIFSRFLFCDDYNIRPGPGWQIL